MTQKTQLRGTCFYCEGDYSRRGMGRHLAACSERKRVMEETDRKGGQPETLFHLFVDDRWQKEFWLHLEMSGKASLEELDYYLRRIWLECCGHLSRFSYDWWRGDDIPMHVKAGQILEPGVELTHTYDFGTESNTVIRVVDKRRGIPTTPHPIALMARNTLPDLPCQECDRPATWLCQECMYEHDEPGLLCDEHAKAHPHDDYGGVMPICNSPRTGACGYDGPATPPY